jgi:O6-methylguanine-DNA--protein-cysteine methyltransferase
MGRKVEPQPLTAGQARYILEKLIDEGKVKAEDITRLLAGMWQEMTFVERRLSELRGVTASVHPIEGAKRTARKVRARVAPAVRKSRALQGQYIGLLRQIPDGDRKRFQDMARDQGREAAVEALKRRLGKV